MSEEYNPEENPFEDHHDALEKGLLCCVSCKEPFTKENVHTEAGWREVHISQMCEDCFDECCKESDESIEKFEAEIQAAYERGLKDGAPKWVSVHDMTPELERWVLIYIPDPGDVRIGMFQGSRWITYRAIEVEVSHWMPLPAPPKGEE